MNTWIFQSMPARFRLPAFLSTNPDRALWKVSKYAKEMLPGDTVYLWQGLGSQKAPLSGIFGKGTIIRGPIDCEDDELSRKFWINSADATKSIPRALISIEHCKTNPIISRQNFSDDQVLRNSLIMRSAIGSNFEVSDDEAAVIYSLYS